MPNGVDDCMLDMMVMGILGGLAALVAFEVHAVSVTATDTEALAWLAIVATVPLVVHLVLVRRYVAVPVSHR